MIKDKGAIENGCKPKLSRFFRHAFVGVEASVFNTPSRRNSSFAKPGDAFHSGELSVGGGTAWGWAEGLRPDPTSGCTQSNDAVKICLQEIF